MALGTLVSPKQFFHTWWRQSGKDTFAKKSDFHWKLALSSLEKKKKKPKEKNPTEKEK